MEPSSGMLNKWKQMERKSCLELMSSMLSYSQVCFQVFVDFFVGLGDHAVPLHPGFLYLLYVFHMQPPLEIEELYIATL